MMNQKWYEKNLSIILLLIFFFPVGLFLMWKYSNWNKVVKIAISIFFGLFLISRIGTTQKATTSTTSKADTTVVQEKPKEKTEEEKAAEAAKQKSDEEAKAKAKADADAKAAAEKAAKEEEDRIGYDTGITYNQLARTPDDYKGKKAKFSGKVVQVMEGDKETDLRIAVDGNYDTILFVAYKSNITSTRILENDYVTVSGKSAGIYKYKSTMGGQISVPSMLVEKIELSK